MFDGSGISCFGCGGRLNILLAPKIIPTYTGLLLLEEKGNRDDSNGRQGGVREKVSQYK